MAKKKAGGFRILRGLNFRGPDGAEVRLEAGEVVATADLPPHGSGQCEAGCSARGPHDWFLTDGVIEPVEE